MAAKVRTQAVWKDRLRRWSAILFGVAVLVHVWGSQRLLRSQQPAFSLLVTLKFTDEVYKEEFLRDIAPVAQYVREHEPQTVAYEVLLSDQDPLQVLVLERYSDKEKAYLEVHKSSRAFLEFRPKLKKMQDDGFVDISGHSYLDSGVGFGDRST